ncbi:MAG: hypothetical protein QOI42_548, partial [Frankiaceae bacterium]|nr:hypothetical protein [Frankiaceae bacterium]
MTPPPADPPPVDGVPAEPPPVPAPAPPAAPRTDSVAEPPAREQSPAWQRRVDAVFGRPAAFGALVAVALAAASYGPQWLLLVAVVLLQLGLTRGWLRLLSVPSPIGAAIVGMGAALVVDMLVVLQRTTDPLRDMGLVLAFSLIAGLVHQIARADRAGLTQSLSATLALAGLTVSGSAYLALPDPHDAGAIVLLGLGVARVVARLTDTVVQRRQGTVTKRRWFGVGVGTAAAGLAAPVVLHATHLAVPSRIALVAVPAAVMLVVGTMLERTATGERRRNA